MASTLRSLPRFTMALLLLCFLQGAARLQPPDSPPAPESELARFNRAVRVLTEEARAALDTGEFPRREADFAASFEGTLDAVVLARRLPRAVDRDPVIDAYVRWQLTSFRPDFNVLSEREFERLLASLPALPEHPRADRALLETLNRAVRLSNERQGGLLTEREADTLGGMLEANTARVGSATARARPGLELRMAIERAAGELGPRAHLVRLERLGAMVSAGWDVESEKRRVNDRFTAGANDATLVEADRQRIISIARRLIGQRRGYLRFARIVERRVEFEANESAVYDFEVNGWARALSAQSP